MSPNIPLSALDGLMPMMALVSPAGVIMHAGPSLRKICPSTELVGRPLLEFFNVARPFGVRSFVDLYRHESCKLRVEVRPENGMANGAANGNGQQGGALTLRGSATRLPDRGGMIVNLSLGISVVDAVTRFNLSAADFAPADPTIDLLYLIEVNNAAFGASRKLNQRLQGAKQVAEVEASTDPLTGLNNRRSMGQVLERLAKQSEPFALMNVDLDLFKTVNDCHGHAAGDYVLKAVSGILLREVRGGDHVARVGGDEFVVVFERCDDVALLHGIAQRIINGLETPVLFNGSSCGISASIGITLSTFYDTPDGGQMLADADAALYQAKNLGRGRTTIFEPNSVGPLLEEETPQRRQIAKSR